MNYPDVCPHCNHKIVKPGGPKGSRVLIMGDAPGFEDVRYMKPFVGQSGQVLRVELALLQTDLNSIRHTNLWLHEPNKIEEDKNWNYELALQEFKGKEVVLFIGADTAKWITNGKYGVSELGGLQLTPKDIGNPLLSIPNIFFSINPAQVLKTGGVGEIKLSLKRFATCAWSYL